MLDRLNKYKTIQNKIILMGVGTVIVFMLLFAYIAYIDTEAILRVHVKGEDVPDLINPQKTINDQLYNENYTDEENIALTLRTLIFWYAIDLSVPFVIIIGVFILITKSITKSIKELEVAATGLKKGDFDTKIDIKATDELAEVGKLMEKMRISIKQKVENINTLMEQKTRLFGQLTHDLKTPLVPIIGLLPKLHAQEQDENKKEIFSMLVSNSNRLYTIIKQTLSLLRLDTPTFKLALKLKDPKELMEQIVKNNEYSITKKDITVEKDIHQTSSTLMDASYITEVMENLISNAIKFTPENKKITFILKEKDNKIFFSIKDEGAGIKKKDITKIFGEFYKADWSRHEASSGLGLSIAKRIIKAHEGEIYAESQGENMGTTFTFWIPIKQTPLENNKQNDVKKVSMI